MQKLGQEKNKYKYASVYAWSTAQQQAMYKGLKKIVTNLIILL